MIVPASDTFYLACSSSGQACQWGNANAKGRLVPGLARTAGGDPAPRDGRRPTRQASLGFLVLMETSQSVRL
jgi:hypothetical protein